MCLEACPREESGGMEYWMDKPTIRQNIPRQPTGHPLSLKMDGVNLILDSLRFLHICKRVSHTASS